MTDQRIKSYRDLIIWQKGIALVKEVYKLTRKFPRAETFGLMSQLRRSAISVPSNIAEGQARQHTREFRQFLFTALGSLAELDTQLYIALELNYLNTEEIAGIDEKITEIRRMIRGLLARLTTGH